MGHWGRAFASIGRNIIGDMKKPTADKFVFTKSWLSFGLAYDNSPRAKALDILDIYPQAQNMCVPFSNIEYKRSNVNPFELYCIVCVAAVIKAKRIFEIGTFDGATTRQLAEACPSASVFTIDLAPENIDAINMALVDDETANIRNNGVGTRYRGTEAEAESLNFMAIRHIMIIAPMRRLWTWSL